jgi:hypothetical protein
MAIHLHSFSAKANRLGDFNSMLGWMLIFVLIVLGAVMAALSGGIGSVFGLTSTVVFGFLVVISAFTFLLRGRA